MAATQTIFLVLLLTSPEVEMNLKRLIGDRHFCKDIRKFLWVYVSFCLLSLESDEILFVILLALEILFM